MDGVMNCTCGNHDTARWCPIHRPISDEVKNFIPHEQITRTLQEIKAHCMGTEFPKRDTDGKVKWVPTAGPQDSIHLDIETFTEWYIRPAVRHLLEEGENKCPNS